MDSSYIPSPPLTPPSSWEWPKLQQQVAHLLSQQNQSADPASIQHTTDTLMNVFNSLQVLKRSFGPEITESLVAMILKSDGASMMDSAASPTLSNSQAAQDLLPIGLLE
jgi:hypothetical protein